MNPIVGQLLPALLVMGVGGVMYLLRSIPVQIFNALRWAFTVSLTVNSEDPCYEWVSEWLALHNYARRARTLKVESGRDSGDGWTISPGYGTHCFWDNGLVVVTRQVVDSKSISWRQREAFHIRMFGRSQERIRRLIDHASFVQQQTTALGIRMWLGGSWTRLRGRSVRSLDTLHMPPALKREMVECARWFFENPEWFAERGVPYRQGFMLYGPPGTGKTTAVIALASHFKKPIYILNLATIKDDNELLMALSVVPQGAIVLIEDVDAAKASEVRSEDEEIEEVKNGITLSGLLNAIDGVAAPEGRLLIMTTNHPEKLDEAITRSARVDKHFFFGPLDTACAIEMAERFFPGMSPELRAAVEAGGDGKAAASWQDAFMAVARTGLVEDLIKELSQPRPTLPPPKLTALKHGTPMKAPG